MTPVLHRPKTAHVADPSRERYRGPSLPVHRRNTASEITLRQPALSKKMRAFKSSQSVVDDEFIWGPLIDRKKPAENPKDHAP